MSMEVSITPKSHFKMLYDLIVFLIILIPFIIYIVINASNDRIKFGGIFVLIVFCIMFVLPVIHIHYTYYKLNSNKGYQFQEDKIIVTDLTDHISQVYQKKDVEKVVISLSPKKMKKSGISFLTFEDYFYIKLIMVDRHEVLLTSLLGEDLVSFSENYFDKEKIAYSVNIYNSI